MHVFAFYQERYTTWFFFDPRRIFFSQGINDLCPPFLLSSHPPWNVYVCLFLFCILSLSFSLSLHTHNTLKTWRCIQDTPFVFHLLYNIAHICNYITLKIKPSSTFNIFWCPFPADSIFSCSYFTLMRRDSWVNAQWTSKPSNCFSERMKLAN